ncbi:hypothetical protein [Gordonia lacunae]|uniref:Uncharacterized protein n=1 Tax=Gordonia lacunae TaxID=417102 RepID=A0A243Q890_9ACTN|nr:hypothetical protein [Gordonia lacunae]OUC77280.1 hypothetical protein CA982_17800 [Gordonia lacunae]
MSSTATNRRPLAEVTGRDQLIERIIDGLDYGCISGATTSQLLIFVALLEDLPQYEEKHEDRPARHLQLVDTSSEVI